MQDSNPCIQSDIAEEQSSAGGFSVYQENRASKSVFAIL